MTSSKRSEKPRRRSLRLRGYDYTRPGAYFVTVSTHRRACLFGHVVDEAMHPNAFGTVVEAGWRALPERYPQAQPGAFVVMPNHVHGVLVLGDDTVADRSSPTGRRRHGLPEIVRAFKAFSSRRINELRHGCGMPVGQLGYYEHVIRNEASLREIEDYIRSNPLRWSLDRENPKNPWPPRAVGAGLRPARTSAAGTRDKTP